jgi:uncharacterized SAM-binding protein YcdF (DUF218 family)
MFIQPVDNKNHDAIIVFAGGSDRIQRGYRLAQLNTAPALIVSPASKKLLSGYEERYGDPGDALYLIEDKADTTLMNALYTAKLIARHRFESVLLVTSDYHMARSLFLLKLATIGTACRIGIHKVDTIYSSPKDWKGRINSLKMAYNEMVQLWGSLAEWGLYIKGGKEERKKTRSSDWSRWLRKHLLFDVRYGEEGA